MHYQHRKTVFMNSIACRRHLMNLATTWLHAITVSRTIVSLLLLFKHSYRSISYLLCYPPCWGENWDCRSRDTGNSSWYVFSTNSKTRLWVVLNFVLFREMCSVRIIRWRDSFVLEFIKERHDGVCRRWFEHMLYILFVTLCSPCILVTLNNYTNKRTLFLKHVQ